MAWGGPTISATYVITFVLALIVIFAVISLMASQNIAGAGTWLSSVVSTLQSEAGLLGLLVVGGIVIVVAGGGRRH